MPFILVVEIFFCLNMKFYKKNVVPRALCSNFPRINTNKINFAICLWLSSMETQWKRHGLVCVFVVTRIYNVFAGYAWNKYGKTFFGRILCKKKASSWFTTWLSLRVIFQRNVLARRYKTNMKQCGLMKYSMVFWAALTSACSTHVVVLLFLLASLYVLPAHASRELQGLFWPWLCDWAFDSTMTC